MDAPQQPLLEFPCSFLLKVIGEGPFDFEDLVLTILNRHVEDLSQVSTSTRPSRGGRYLAVSVEFEALSRDQLDGIYRELGAHERVRWVI